MDRLTLRSYAKVNLHLEILARREDGYHEIETVLQSVDLFDSLSLELTDGPLTVFCDNPEVPDGPPNLAYRAADMFLRQLEKESGLRVTIEKRIPVGGGLGGGSSNAASVLRGINAIFGEPFSLDQLLSLSEDIGSDVPFLLKGGTALARGKGEILDFSLPTPPIWFVLVYPNFSVSTNWAYSKLNLSLTKSASSTNMIVKTIRGGKLPRIVSNLRNGFEEVVFGRYPELRKIKEEITSYGALGASLSGSGSSLFGICEGEEQAQRVSRQFSNSGYWVKAVRALSQEETL